MIPLLPRPFLDAVEHRCVVVGDEVGQHHPNHFGRLLAQALSERIRPVIMLLGQGFHFLAHLLSYLMTVT